MSYARIYRLAVREARLVEEAKAAQFRADQKAAERAQLEAGTLAPREAYWHSREEAHEIARR